MGHWDDCYRDIKICGFDRYCGGYRWANAINEAHLQHPDLNAKELLPHVQEIEADIHFSAVQSILCKIKHYEDIIQSNKHNIALGAALLNEIRPGWEDQVDIKLLSEPAQYSCADFINGIPYRNNGVLCQVLDRSYEDCLRLVFAGKGLDKVYGRPIPGSSLPNGYYTQAIGYGFSAFEMRSEEFNLLWTEFIMIKSINKLTDE